MAAPYSMDLRTRVLQDSEAGVLVEGAGGAVSRQSGVGRRAEAAAARDRVDRAAQADEVSRAGAGRPGRRGSPALVAARPDATLAELREALRTSAGVATVWRELVRLQFTVKKNDSRRRTAPA